MILIGRSERTGHAGHLSNSLANITTFDETANALALHHLFLMGCRALSSGNTKSQLHKMVLTASQSCVLVASL